MSNLAMKVLELELDNPSKKTSTIISSEKFDSIDGKLIQTGRWAITLVQIQGYLPFSIWKNQSFRFKWISIPVFSYIFLAAVAVAQYFVTKGMDRPQNSKDYITTYTQTENVAYALVGLIVLLSTTGLKVMGYIERQQVKTLWERTSALLAKFTHAGFNFFGDHEYVLKEIRSSCRTSALLIYLLATVQMVSIFVSGNSYLAPNNGISTLVIFVQAYWYGYLVLQGGHVVWILFFIKMYIGFFHLISKELSKLNERSKDNNSALAESKIQTCISLFREVEAEVGEYNHYFGSKIIAELLNSIICILTFAFFSIQLAIKVGGIGMGHLCVALPFLVYFKALNDLGGAGSELDSECRGIIKAIGRLGELDVDPGIKLKVRKA
jgi:hypothetical protein